MVNVRCLYFAQLREETKALLSIWSTFGLTGEDAMKLVTSGGIDFEAKIQEIRKLVFRIVAIIKEEVKDENKQQIIFNRIANEIKENGLEDKIKVIHGSGTALEKYIRPKSVTHVYSIEAIKKYGFWRGIKMSTKRISRCHPWQKPTIDPVE